MSNNVFLVIVGAIIFTIMSVMIAQEFEDCASGNVKACPGGADRQ
jgi:hypothetical protein